MGRALLFSLMLFWPALGRAHPHVFIDVALQIEVEADGTFSGIVVEWRYDSFYSLLVLEEGGYDPDMDGEVTEAARAALDGFDLNWVEGFEGDLYVTRDGMPVVLGAPVSRGLSVEDGQIVSRHLRPLSGPADDVLVEAYDPTFYTAYDLGDRVSVTGTVCDAEITPVNLDKAYAALEELLFAKPQFELEDNFPEVGRSFADKVRISC